MLLHLRLVKVMLMLVVVIVRARLLRMPVVQRRVWLARLHLHGILRLRGVEVRLLLLLLRGGGRSRCLRGGLSGLLLLLLGLGVIADCGAHVDGLVGRLRGCRRLLLLLL